MDRKVSDKVAVSINLRGELGKYSLTGKWNDYVGVQKEVLSVLRDNNFFKNNMVINRETRMQIVISPKDVRETFGKGKRFQSLPKELKEYKVATMGKMKEIIEDASLFMDNVANIHPEIRDEFAYFRNSVVIDGKEVIVRISVKKKVGSNHFHIHHIDTNIKSPELLGPSRKTEVFETQDFKENLSQD